MLDVQSAAIKLPEFRKANTDIKTAGFGDDGVCDACKFAEFKKSIDWDGRRQQLEQLCDKFRKSDGGYDVLVPGSGGKDSMFVSHYLKYHMGMNPLTVTWAPHEYTDVGLRNMRSWFAAGLQTLQFMRTMIFIRSWQSCFENLVNPFNHLLSVSVILAPSWLCNTVSNS